MHSQTNPTRLLVLGSPRSGTSLLAAMLGRHSQIAMTHEDTGDAWTRVVGKPITGVKLVAPNQIELDHTWRAKSRRCLRRVQRYGVQNLGLPWPRFKLRSVFSIRDFLAWPLGCIIGIVRNPLEAVDSIRRRGGHVAGEALYRWRRGVEILEYLRREHPERTCVVHYDHLVRAPESCVARCLDWLGLPDEPGLIAGNTINYGSSDIDASKAGQDGDACFAHPVFQDQPHLRVAYRRLLDESA